MESGLNELSPESMAWDSYFLKIEALPSPFAIGRGRLTEVKTVYRFIISAANIIYLS